MADALIHPKPDLRRQPGSGLNFPWVFATSKTMGKGIGAFGPDGVTWGEVMYIDWEDLKAAVQQLVGYSFRNTANNPFAVAGWSAVSGAAGSPITITSANHGLADGNTVLISGVLGNLAANGTWAVTVTGNDTFQIGNNTSGVYVSGTGEFRTAGSLLNRILPWQHPQFNQLWVKRISQVQGVILRGNSAQVVLIPNALPVQTVGNGGGVGAGGGNFGPFTQFQLAQLTIEFWRPPYAVRTDSDITIGGERREWLRYTDREWSSNTQMLSRESTSWDYIGKNGSIPGGQAQKVTHHKVSRKWYQIPEACLFMPVQDKTPSGDPYNLLYTQDASLNPITTFSYTSGWPITGCVNSPIGGGASDADPTLRFLGAYMGTLLYESYQITPQPLQLPAALMQILQFGQGEPISQVQYDVTFHFDKFDPPPGEGVAFRGHNLMPHSGTGMWFPVQSKNTTIDYNGNPKKVTPFQYADLSSLFQVL